MSKFDEKMKWMQENMYFANQERYNALLTVRLQTRTKAENVRSLFSVTALALPSHTVENKTLQRG